MTKSNGNGSGDQLVHMLVLDLHGEVFGARGKPGLSEDMRSVKASVGSIRRNGWFGSAMLFLITCSMVAMALKSYGVVP
jgi:hypothetical protein